MTEADKRTGVRAVDSGSAEAPPVLGDSAFRGVDPRVHRLQERAEALVHNLEDLESSLLEPSAGDTKHAKRSIMIRSLLTPLTTTLLAAMMVFARGLPGFTWLVLLFALYSGLSLYSFVKGYKLPISSSDSKKQRRIVHSEAAYFSASVVLMTFIFAWHFLLQAFARHEFIAAIAFSFSHAVLTNWPRIFWARKALEVGKRRTLVEAELAAVKKELAALLGHGETEPPDSAAANLDASSAELQKRGGR